MDVRKDDFSGRAGGCGFGKAGRGTVTLVWLEGIVGDAVCMCGSC
jgi:hypothetical protein